MGADSAAAEKAPFQPGDRLAERFLIETTLGVGGMGAVFRVRDERSGRTLALKCLRALKADAELANSQFEHEYHALCQLSHPHIVEVYDYGVHAGCPYYTMELLEGGDLRKRGKLSWPDVCKVLCDVSSALAVLHSRRLVHRDISARNIFFAENGRTKLIDFGAMAPMGVAKHIVGTPPFVPPEALQLQSLDGRADLYALGGLAYFLLTGRYAYPARSLEQLRDVWRSPPPTLRQYEPTLPEALDRVVMELLQLDRMARPRSAAEVMERLAGIAGLSLAERPEVSRAYLSTPMLVGRDGPLQDVRTALIGAMQGGGSSFLIEGEPGFGRSRFLDACVLEAKLLGAVVLRGDGSDGGGRDYGLAQALCAQLVDAAPDVCVTAARSRRAVLAHVLPAFGAVEPNDAMPERRVLQSALRDFVLAVARKRQLVIAVDDIEAADEPSAALIAVLAHGAKRRHATVLATAHSGAEATGALGLMQKVARRLELAPLSRGQTDALLASLFGEVEHVATLGERVFELAQGNPRWTMALCEQLVESRVARYEAGSWTLPTVLAPSDLPKSLTDALAARAAGLSPDARALCDALSLTDAALIPSTQVGRLTDHDDSGRTFRAIDELVAAYVLRTQGDRLAFVQPELANQLRVMLDPERARMLHARIAALFSDDQHPLLFARHLFAAGDERRALDCVASVMRMGRHRPEESGAVLALLEHALEAAPRVGVSHSTELDLRRWLLGFAAMLGRYEMFLRYHEPLLLALRCDSGLVDYEALGQERAPEQRLERAFALAEARHEHTPDAERGYPVREAISALAGLSSAYVGMAAVAQDLALLGFAPSLTPFIPAAPGLEMAERHVQFQRFIQQGRFDRVVEVCLAMLARLEADDHAGCSAEQATSLRIGVLYTLALFAAVRGHPSAADRLDELEEQPGFRGNAWRVRMTYELMRGNMDAAIACQRRSELVNLQDGAFVSLPGTTARVELQAYLYAEDLIGVKRSVERIEALVKVYPGWTPTLAIARCHYRRLQGDFEGALAALAPGLAQATPGSHLDFGLCAMSHVLVLAEAGRAEEAVSLGRGYLACCEDEQLIAARDGLLRPLAEALLRLGRTGEALSVIEQNLARYEAIAMRGLQMGLVYETRARVAIAMRDEVETRRYAELCAREYQGGRNVQLGVKYERLMHEAEAVGVVLTTGIKRAADVLASAAVTASSHTVSSRILAFAGSSKRAQEILRMLLETSGAKSGHLYGPRSETLQLLGSVGEPKPDDALRATLEHRFFSESRAPEGVTAVDSQTTASTAAQVVVDPAHADYEFVLLFSDHDGENAIAAIAALRYGEVGRRTMRRVVLDEISHALIEADLVDPFPC